MSHYERIRCQGRTEYLRVDIETSAYLGGIAVDREGEDIVPAGGKYDRRRRIIQKTEITRRTRMVIDRKYAELVEAGKETV